LHFNLPTLIASLLSWKPTNRTAGLGFWMVWRYPHLLGGRSLIIWPRGSWSSGQRTWSGPAGWNRPQVLPNNSLGLRIRSGLQRRWPQGRRCITVGRFQGVEGVHRIAGTDHQQAVEQCVHQQHFDLFNFHWYFRYFYLSVIVLPRFLDVPLWKLLI